MVWYPIPALDFCGNRSGAAKPCFSASWGLGSMPTNLWFCNHEFMVLLGRITKNGHNEKSTVPVISKSKMYQPRTRAVDFWIFGFLDFWIFGFLDFWIFGFLDFFAA
jgi:hypothetical protein